MATTAPTSPASTAPGAIVEEHHDSRYVDWAAIIAGAIFATTLSFVLTTFGGGIGLSLVSAEPGEGVSLFWVTIAAGIWFIWVVVSSYAAGGYLAGRLRRRIGDAVPDEVELRDGAHGLLVWALGALIATVMAIAGAGGVLSPIASVTGSAAGAASGSVAEMASEELDYYAGRMLRGESGSISPEARSEVASILGRSITQGEVTDDDREYLAQITANETDMSEEEARAQIDNVISEAESARDQAIEIAEQVRIASLIGAFVMAATMLVAAAAAYFAAATGGSHRDQRISFRHFGRPY